MDETGIGIVSARETARLIRQFDRSARQPTQTQQPTAQQAAHIDDVRQRLEQCCFDYISASDPQISALSVLEVGPRCVVSFLLSLAGSVSTMALVNLPDTGPNHLLSDTAFLLRNAGVGVETDPETGETVLSEPDGRVLLPSLRNGDAFTPWVVAQHPAGLSALEILLTEDGGTLRALDGHFASFT